MTTSTDLKIRRFVLLQDLGLIIFQEVVQCRQFRSSLRCFLETLKEDFVFSSAVVFVVELSIYTFHISV